MAIKDISKIDEELDKKLNNSLCQVISIVEEIAKKVEEEYGGSKTWKSFRRDELLLQSIQKIIFDHLKNTPPDVEMQLKPEHEYKLNNALKSIFLNITEVSSAVAKNHHLPMDVVLTRTLHNVIMNLIGHYARLKIEYARKHKSINEEIGETKCAVCEKEVPRNDLTYPNVHYSCAVKIQKEMEELGMIKVLLRHEIKLVWRFTESFEKILDKTLESVRKHILHDETVDEDIIDMQGVIKAILDYVPKSVPAKRIACYAASIFNSLMTQKYGSPLPPDKRFDSRIKEFYEEVYLIPMSEEEAKIFKVLKGKFNS